METEQKYDEESLQHIYALLRRHRSNDVIRMFLDVAQSRPASTITSASRFSQLSSESRYSGFGTLCAILPVVCFVALATSTSDTTWSIWPRCDEVLHDLHILNTGSFQPS
ncbi:hypothetical protein PMIN06_008369 [Paraphaeosphaeria minitans]